MNDELDNLKKHYRDIEAPPYLASRVRASVADKPRRSHLWLPAATLTALAAAAVWIIPFGEQPSADLPRKPSLSALASLKPEKPAVGTPSLSQIRTVSVPKMPVKPTVKPAKPQTNSINEPKILKEKDHANV